MKQAGKIKKGKFNYEEWFFIHSGMKKEEELYISEISKDQSYEEYSLRDNINGSLESKYTSSYGENKNIPNEIKIDIHDYASWFQRHSVKSEPIKEDNKDEEVFEKEEERKRKEEMPKKEKKKKIKIKETEQIKGKEAELIKRRETEEIKGEEAEEIKRKRKEAKESCNIYTKICKKYYPLVINPFDKSMENICNTHSNIISFFLLYM